MQICPQKRAICKFSPNFLTKSLPSVREEGFDIGVRDRFAGDFVEPFHQCLHVLDRNLLSGSMVESVVNLLCGHILSIIVVKLLIIVDLAFTMMGHVVLHRGVL